MMKNKYLKIHVFFVAMMFSACASIWPFGDKKQEEPASSKTDASIKSGEDSSEKTADSAKNPNGESEKSVAPSSSTSALSPKAHEELLLKQAQMVSRMEEIEAELIHQREKIRLLEQGLLTGIAPDDLKRSKSDGKPSGVLKSHSAQKDKSKKFKETHNEERSESLADHKTPESEGPEDLSIGSTKAAAHGGESDYKVKMQVAKEHYQSGRFGLAIADFAGVTREFGDKVGDGEVRVWLGRSYLGLKEYGTARGEFETYLKSWPTGELAGSARLDLAKSYVGMGLKERARGELRRVIKDFEGQDISETASLELKNLNGGL